jgi:aldehyde:ferredoxin oxidoreductase
MKYGASGRILLVDLTKGEWSIERPPERFYRTYVGGSALGAYYVLKNTPRGVDPLAGENTLVFALSVCTGAPISGQSRMTTVAKSPLTGAIGDGQCGGFFPAELKFAGFDAVVVTGKARAPVYLWLHDGEVELRPASHLWGHVTGDVDRLIREELGDPKIEVAQCGLGGENRVRFAGVINMSNRANGRTGMGAVMGSKNLKAIAVRGSRKPGIADEAKLRELAKWGPANFEDSGVYSLGTLGTAGIVVSQDQAGGLPTRNWSSGTLLNSRALDGKTMFDTVLKERDTCYACTVRCKRVVEITEGPFLVDPYYGGPEYETLAAFGSYCGIDDLAAVSRANQLCNMYGLDTISCGATIAWAMDCYERGILNSEATDGIDLRFGNAEAMVQMVEKIAHRQGLGDALAEGSARAAQRFGPQAQELVVAVKKQEFPAHMPQVKRSLALIYAVNPFGADHMSHEHDPSYRDYADRLAMLGLHNPQPDRVLNEEKIRFALTTQYTYSFLDTANFCQFVFGPAWQLYGPDQMVETVNAITGWDLTLDEAQQIGARRLNLLRAFNAREGLDRSDDRLPKKLEVPLRGGRSDGIAISPEDMEKAKDQYYAMAGWDVATGIPTRTRLEELELAWVADEIGL